MASQNKYRASSTEPSKKAAKGGSKKSGSKSPRATSKAYNATGVVAEPTSTSVESSNTAYIMRLLNPTIATLDENRKSVLARMLREISRQLETITAEQVLNALEAPTDAGSIASVLSAGFAHDEAVRSLDPFASAILRSAAVKRQLHEDAGGTFTTAELTELLDITQQSIDKRVQRGKLIAIRNASGDLRFPAIQFTDGGTVRGLEQVLDAFTVDNPWTRLSVLLSRSDAVGGIRVIDALRSGKLDSVLDVVRSYGA
ncbi:MAG: hypothetical protein H7X80_11685 [bacterium]|nr:hypothetical protein [Candidatus Kapabacteria bacterium]